MPRGITNSTKMSFDPVESLNDFIDYSEGGIHRFEVKVYKKPD